MSLQQHQSYLATFHLPRPPAWARAFVRVASAIDPPNVPAIALVYMCQI